MTVDHIHGSPGTLPEPEPRRSEKPLSKPRTDAVELSSGNGADRATYFRTDAVGSSRLQPASAEEGMADLARAKRLDAIRQRIEAGVYDSREVIELIVDRLLERWQLEASHPPSREDT